MKRLAKKVGSIVDRSLDVTFAAACVVLMFVMVSVSSEVFLRYLLDMPQMWVVEVAEYSLLFITFMAGGWVLRREGHVKMDLLVNRLKPKAQALFDFITSFIGIGLVGLLFVWYGVVTTKYVYVHNITADGALDMVPEWTFTWVIPVGGFLLFLQFVRRTFGFFRSYRSPVAKTKRELVDIGV